MLGGQFGPLADQPLVHRWADGLYIREITNPAGSLIVTKVHKTEHPWFLMSGTVLVRHDEQWERFEAPYCGLTLPGTRRVIFAPTEVVWITVHPNPDNGRDLVAIEERLIERRENEDGFTSHERFDALLHSLPAPVPGSVPGSPEEVYAKLCEVAEAARQSCALPGFAEAHPIDYHGLRERAVSLAAGGEA